MSATIAAAVAALSLNAAGFISSTMEVNKKGKNGKYEPIGKVEYFIPTLEACGIQAEVEGIEDGLPTYKDDKMQWLFNAAVAAIKAKARNALIPQSIDIKPGQSIAADWDMLLAEGVRGGDALATARDLKQAFAAFVATLDKSAKVKETLVVMFGNKKSLATQSANNKSKFSEYLQSFAEVCEEGLLERGQKYVQDLLDACEEEEVELE